MARTKKQESLDEEIEKAEALVLKRKEMYDKSVATLKDLRDKQEQAKREALLSAVAASRHSYDEIMAFIQSDPDAPDL
jgi:hypothetical protein